VSSPRVYWRGRIHPLGRIGGNKRLKSVPLYFAERPAKYGPRRATQGSPRAPTTTAGRPANQARRSFASDASPRIPPQNCKLILTSVNVRRSFSTLSTDKRKAGHSRRPCKRPRDEPGKKAAPLGQNRVSVKQNEKADQARLSAHDGGGVDKIDVCTADHGL